MVDHPHIFPRGRRPAPGSTFSSSYMGIYVNSPINGTVNVAPYASFKMKLWGPAAMLIVATPLYAGAFASTSTTIARAIPRR